MKTGLTLFLTEVSTDDKPRKKNQSTVTLLKCKLFPFCTLCASFVLYVHCDIERV